MTRKVTGTVGLGAVAVVMTLLAGGCWNGGNHSYHLGDVSLGQQLIDLKAALDQGAVDPEEYARMKEAITALSTGCGNDGD
jgi:hypothetical protein